MAAGVAAGVDVLNGKPISERRGDGSVVTVRVGPGVGNNDSLVAGIDEKRTIAGARGVVGFFSSRRRSFLRRADVAPVALAGDDVAASAGAPSIVAPAIERPVLMNELEVKSSASSASLAT